MALIVITMVLFAGCTSQSGDKTSINPVETTKQPTHQDTQGSKITNSSVKEPIIPATTNKTASGDSYYNIRIVQPSVLDKLQKEMGPGEYLVKSDKGNTIGIVSSQGLVLRGDLVQLEQDTGGSGKDFDKSDVSLHLLDITFGLDNSKISLFKTDKDYEFWFDAYYSDSEVKYVKDLAKELNSISGTTQFEDEDVVLGFLQTNYATIPNNYYNIKIVTEKVLKQYYDDQRKDSDHLIKDKDGVLIGIVNTDYLYLLNTMSEADEKYYILKGLLYSMGLHGTSYKNRDSFFYRTELLNRDLTDLDKEAIKLLYGGGLKSGNTFEDARKTLGLST